MADRPFPPVLRYATTMFNLVSTTRSGGAAINDDEQIVLYPSGRWRAEVAIPVNDRRYGPVDRQDAVLAFRWLVRGGRGAAILVPHRDGRGPAHRAGIVPCGGVPYSDGAKHSDGSGFAQSFTNAVLAMAGAMNATQIQVRLPVGLRIVPGMRFSMPDGYMHEVGDVLAFNGTDLWTLAIGPWFLADYAAGTALDFDRPVCRMRLATDDAGALALSLNRSATPTLSFVGLTP